MSWLEDIKTIYTITTGDGKQFVPKWLNATKNVRYNTTEFNFPNVPGSLIDRREILGTQYAIEIHFDGDDHLDIAQDFEVSARDKRFWIIKHPFYGSITVQPDSLLFDNSIYNVSKITGIVTETITDTNPKTSVIPEDKIEEDAETTNELNALSFENNVDPTSSDINLMEANAEQFYVNANNNIQDDEDGQNFFNVFNKAKSDIAKAASDSGTAMRSTQNLIQTPSKFKQNLESRLNMLKGNFESLRATIEGVVQNIPISERHIYENSNAAVITGMAVASSLPFDENDYRNRTSVNDTINLILDSYNTYLSDLDNLQTGGGGDPNDYVPNADSITELNNLVNFTMSNLFDIGLEAKQERFLILEDDSDFITLSHRLYSLETDDSTITELMRNNNLGLNGILNIKKGTTITYYI